MSDKILDCSSLSDRDFALVSKDFAQFVNGSRPRCFGYVDKHELKWYCKVLKYTDKRSFVKGGIVTAGLIWLGTKIKKYIDSKKEPVEENVPHEEES